MDRALPDALVTHYESTISGLTLPDPDDRHVLAAAIHCGAHIIVTFNVRDFPAGTLDAFGISAQHPDEFVETLFDLNPPAVIGAARRQRQQLNDPPVDAASLLCVLQKQGLARTAQRLSDHLSSI
jgi:hypothetical protein